MDPKSPVHADPRRQGRTVLCVDDDERHLRALARLLALRGYRAVTYTDPEEALDNLARTNPDLAILDVRMPGLNGLNLAEEIQDCFEGRLPVVLLTACGEDRDRVEGRRRGASFYLTKPCPPPGVLAVVDYLIGGLDERQRRILAAALP